MPFLLLTELILFSCAEDVSEYEYQDASLESRQRLFDVPPFSLCEWDDITFSISCSCDTLPQYVNATEESISTYNSIPNSIGTQAFGMRIVEENADVNFDCQNLIQGIGGTAYEFFDALCQANFKCLNGRCVPI